MNDSCRLCGSSNRKRVKSHIAPAFLFREVKRRGNGLLIISRDGREKIRSSKDGPKDHKILCNSCEENTQWIDGDASKAFLGKKYKIIKCYSNRQEIIGYSKEIDPVIVKRFAAFSILKASWSNNSLYSKFKIEPNLESRLLPYLQKEIPIDRGIIFFLFYRQPTYKDLPNSPEVHNGRIEGDRYPFFGHPGMMVMYHFLEFTCLIFISDNPNSTFPIKQSIQNNSTLLFIRSSFLNKKLDEVALEFAQDRLRSEHSPAIA